MRTIVLETGERLHLLGISLNKTETQLKSISHDSNSNFHLFRQILGRLINGKDEQRDRKSACFNYKWKTLYRQTVMFSTIVTNHTQTLDLIRSELMAFKMAVHNFGYILDDPLSSLTRG